MQEKQLGNKQASQDFLEKLFANAPAELLITLWLKGPKANKTIWLPLTPEGILNLIEAGLSAAENYDVYFSTCPAVQEANQVKKPQYKRISKKDVAGVPALFIDCDTLEDPEKAGKKVAASKEEAASTLSALSLPPTYMVESGHGIHAYWLLEEMLSPVIGRKTLRDFANAIRGATGWEGLDVGASEPARVLRLPGTLNHKSSPPTPVVLRPESGRFYKCGEIEKFMATYGAQATDKESKSNQTEFKETWLGVDDSTSALTDDEVIAKAPAAKNGKKFTALWQGDTSGYKGNHSDADGALCCILGFWTQKNHAQTDRLFRRSGLFRQEKWDKVHTAEGETYGQLTIRTSFEKVNEVYKPGKQSKEVNEKLRPFYEAFGKVKGYGLRNGEIVSERVTPEGEIISTPLSTFSALIAEETSRDDGAEVFKEFQIIGRDCFGNVLDEITVKASDYSSMSWPGKFWGAAGNLYPGNSNKDKTRFAIIEASKRATPPIRQRAVFTHTGWREVNGELKYLYNGGAIGGEGVDVELDGNLSHYQLPENVEDVKIAIEASLSVLQVAPPRIAFPVLAHTYLAPLCHFLHLAQRPPAFVLFLSGGTGTRKTTLAVLEMAHFGKEWSATKMPASFADTVNSIRNKAFLAKDMPLLVDDYHPVSNPKQRVNMTQTAHDLATAWGDYAERGRLRSDMTLATAKPPRGLGLITGEDAPAVTESGTARFYVIEVGLTDIPVTESLRKAQEAASTGLLAESMRAYIEYLIKKPAEEHADIFKRAFEEYRKEAHSSLTGAHGRLAGAAAWLWIGLGTMLNFFLESGAISIEESERFWSEGKRAILENVAAQQEGMREEKPTRIFLQAINDLVSAGKMRLHQIENISQPYDPIAGYYDESYLYLIPGVAFADVQSHLRDQGQTFPVGWPSLRKRLAEEQLIVKDDKGGPTVVKYISHKKSSGRLLVVKRSELKSQNLDPVIPKNSYFSANSSNVG